LTTGFDFMTLTLGPMAKGFAAALQVPQPEVDRVARVLRSEKLLTTGARGVNAPAQQYIDAARLLLPFLITDKAPLAAQAVRDFGELLCWKVEAHEKHQSCKLGGNSGGFGIGHKLEDGIAELIRIYAEDGDEEYFKEARSLISSVTVKSTELTAVINMVGAEYYYSEKYMLAHREYFLTHFEKAYAGGAESFLDFQEKDPLKKHVELAEKYARRIWTTREIHQGVIDEIAGLFVDKGGHAGE